VLVLCVLAEPSKIKEKLLKLTEKQFSPENRHLLQLEELEMFRKLSQPCLNIIELYNLKVS
jgi:hypothetical protein